IALPGAVIVEALQTFRSVKRRLEVKAVAEGVTIIDDFAHHPTAIRETLRALRERYPGQRLIAVLEPRSNTLRRNVFEVALVESLALADMVVLAGVFKSESIPASERLDPSEVIRRLRERGIPAGTYQDADVIVAALSPEVRSGDVVAILSNGGFGGIYQKLPRGITEAAIANRLAVRFS
ncbi:MAG TPA: cyanophycin synthetase, partial [Tepidisphaeraceae bacterium]|nr:cyanophycin synthetase [Tepidisphaeraceae bacterium]